ncbi:MAG: response regulator [Candidatus Methanoperedens sp.]|nr:response regulator [Candidatus Methanoperedens sp.]
MARAKILVVDDEEMNVVLLDNYLSRDYDVSTAYDGDEALLIVEKDPPDLILLDIMMPKMNGYEVCNKLKNNPKTMGIPIIMVTALQQKKDKIKAIGMFADDFLTKPVDFNELTAKVKSLLRLKEYHDALIGDTRFLS